MTGKIKYDKIFTMDIFTTGKNHKYNSLNEKMSLDIFTARKTDIKDKIKFNCRMSKVK